ncbi:MULTISPECIES: hypothetical protein [unclassified Luteimonas]
MKFTLAYASVALAVASPLTFFAGASALVVTYVPQVPAEAIAKARDRGYLLILIGILGFVASSTLAGHNFRQSPTPAILALSAIVLSLLFPLALVLFA